MLFDPDEPGALRRALEHFLARPTLADEMRARCLERARDFWPQRVMGEHVALYEEVVAGRGARARV
jgi:hypothetical protein